MSHMFRTTWRRVKTEFVFLDEISPQKNYIKKFLKSDYEGPHTIAPNAQAKVPVDIESHPPPCEACFSWLCAALPAPWISSAIESV